MAVETGEADVKKRLKELEQDLAKELDQHVNLTQPSDTRIEGNVLVNPSLEVQKPSPASPTSQTKQEAVSFTSDAVKDQTATTIPGQTSANASTIVKTPPASEPAAKVQNQEKSIEELFNELDDGFKKSLQSIEDQVGKIEASNDIFSASIKTDFFAEEQEDEQKKPEVAVEEKSEKKGQTPSLAGAVKGFFAQVFGTGYDIGFALFQAAKKARTVPPKQIAVDLRQAVVPSMKKLLDGFIDIFRSFKNYTLKQIVRFVAIIILIACIYYLGRDIVANFRPDREKDPFLKNLNDVADTVQVFPDDEGGEDIESPLRHTEYVVLVHRIVANLKATSPRRNPMIALELYVEASNQECAIEINERRVEVRDNIERVLEQTTFDEIDSPQGKTRLKRRIITALNRILNRGTSKRVFFRSLNVQK